MRQAVKVAFHDATKQLLSHAFFSYHPKIQNTISALSRSLVHNKAYNHVGHDVHSQMIKKKKQLCGKINKTSPNFVLIPACFATRGTFNSPNGTKLDVGFTKTLREMNLTRFEEVIMESL